VKEAKATVQPLVTEPQQKHDPAVVPPMEKSPTSQRQDVVAKLPRAQETPVGEKTLPEVLVPRDQEILLAEYAGQWNLHKRAPLVARDSDDTILAQLQVAPIQIDELGVKLLAEEK
jgi:hypothetical protein